MVIYSFAASGVVYLLSILDIGGILINVKIKNVQNFSRKKKQNK